MRKLLEISDSSDLSYIFGVKDRNIKLLETELGISVNVESHGILLKGNKDKIEKAEHFIKSIIALKDDGFNLTIEELKNYLNLSTNITKLSLKSSEFKDKEQFGIVVPSSRKKMVLPKTNGQIEYINSIKEYDIVFAIGPAGTGKTYLAMAMAVNCLQNKLVRRIILVRPAIEAGESLGFLPGDIKDKLDPYLRPLYDALYDMIDVDIIEEHLETGVIEIVPLAYMRGRTLNNAFVVLDEAQNCTSEQLKMFLTRLGYDSKAVITGDITQSDLPGGNPGGLIEAVNILAPIKGIKFCNLTKGDVVRHPLIQEIIQVYENFYRKKTK